MIPLTPQAPPEAGSADGAAAASAYALLFDADGSDREMAIGGIELARLSERQLVWIDLQQREGRDALACLRSLGLEEAARALEERQDDEAQPRLQNFGDWFLVQAVAVAHPGSLRFTAEPLTLVIGRNFVVTVHRDPLPFLDQLRERERGDTQLGMLSAESFTVSLLDWQLTTYFEAIADLEAEIDRLEVQMLMRRMRGEHLPDMARMRRGASQLRRLLAPHRAVFGAMARPDFRPDPEGINDKQFRALNERFERSMDAVDNARDLVIGSFELFATRTAHRTNETMRVLTFVTVLLGTLSVLAGVLGMNFEAPLFHTGQQGFVITIVAMLVLVAIAVAVARWRRWL